VVKLLALLLAAGCGSESEEAPLEPSVQARPVGCAEDEGVAARRAAMGAIGHPIRDPKPPAAELLDDVLLEGDVRQRRWRMHGAEVVWAAPSLADPEGLHVVYGDDGSRSLGLVERGSAVLWLPGPPRRPETTELLLRRAKHPPARDALVLAWAAVDAARYGRFGTVPSGRILVHAAGDPVSAAWLAAFDPRVEGIVDLPPAEGGSLAPFAAAACKSIAFERTREGSFPSPGPKAATDAVPSPEPPPWRVTLPPPSTAGEARTAPHGWVILGPVPDGFVAPNVVVPDPAPWGDDPDPRISAARELGVDVDAIGFLGTGAHGVVALRLAGRFGGAAVTLGSPTTLWTDQPAAPAWPGWVFKPGGNASSDPWWLAADLGDRAVLVDPRDAHREPWTTPPPPGIVAASLDEALGLLAGTAAGVAP
jgi:hypothetical protein